MQKTCGWGNNGSAGFKNVLDCGFAGDAIKIYHLERLN